MKIQKKPILGLAVLTLTLLSLGAIAPYAHATSITYGFNLIDPSNSTYDGTATVTFSTVPASTYTNLSGTVTALSFTVDGNTFSKSDAGATFSVFELSSLSPITIYDITFADSLGTSPNRLTLDTTGGYAYYYNNLQSVTTGNFGNLTVASAVPEPNSLLLLGTGLLGAGGLLYRRRAVA